jgi:aspartyl-tRNA(Asn)/glutamyl-tRNA(Gln) amidotransferase subunit C
VRLSPEEVEHVALLARLELTGEEPLRLTEQLNSILGFFEQLQQLDTSGVAPTSHAIPRQNVFRPDEAGASLGAEAALENAPDKSGDCFRVPRVIE